MPDPRIEEPTDAIIKVTSTGLCGSDLHLYETLAPVHGAGRHRRARADGDRRGGRRAASATSRSATASSCRSTSAAARAGCATRPLQPVRDHPEPRARHGRELLRLQQALRPGPRRPGRVPPRAVRRLLPSRCPRAADDRFLFLSDVLPTAWQARAVRRRPRRRHPARPRARSDRRHGGPHGACMRGHRVISVDRVPERLERRRGVRRRAARPRRRRRRGAWATSSARPTGGRGADSVIDAVGMEAHGSPRRQAVQKFVGLLPDALAEPLMKNAGVDRLPRSTRPSTRYAAAARSRSPASTAAQPIRCRCCSSSTSRSRSAWARPTCAAGPTTSCRHVRTTTTRSGSTPSRPTTSRSPRRPEPTELPEEGGRHGQGRLPALSRPG